MDKYVYLGVGNTYGSVLAYKWDGKFYISIDDCTVRPSEKEVSEEFYDACVKEFGEVESKEDDDE